MPRDDDVTAVRMAKSARGNRSSQLPSTRPCEAPPARLAPSNIDRLQRGHRPLAVPIRLVLVRTGAHRRDLEELVHLLGGLGAQQRRPAVAPYALGRAMPPHERLESDHHVGRGERGHG